MSPSQGYRPQNKMPFNYLYSSKYQKYLIY